MSAVKAAVRARAAGSTTRAGTRASSRPTGGWMNRTSRMEKNPQAIELVRQMWPFRLNFCLE